MEEVRGRIGKGKAAGGEDWEKGSWKWDFGGKVGLDSGSFISCLRVSVLACVRCCVCVCSLACLKASHARLCLCVRALL